MGGSSLRPLAIFLAAEPPQGLLCSAMASSSMMNQVMPAVGGLAGLWAASKVLPVMYHWDLIPGVGSPAYWERAAKIKYDNYTNGFVYVPYDTGDPVREMPSYCQGKMYLKQ